MSPEGLVFCDKCNFKVSGNLPDFPIGENSFTYPRDKEPNIKLSEQLMEHHIESGKNELHGHKNFTAVINGIENICIEARSYYVEYYKSNLTNS